MPPQRVKMFPQEILDYVDMIKGKIVSGDIQPPSTYEELDAFVPPAL